MPKTEEGDFELLIGNKQLLTVFFVVVILLGVFFTMGYIVGKNSVVAGDAGNKEKQPKFGGQKERIDFAIKMQRAFITAGDKVLKQDDENFPDSALLAELGL